MHGLIVKSLQESNAILVLKLVLELYSVYVMADKNNFIYLIYSLKNPGIQVSDMKGLNILEYFIQCAV